MFRSKVIDFAAKKSAVNNWNKHSINCRYFQKFHTNDASDCAHLPENSILKRILDPTINLTNNTIINDIGMNDSDQESAESIEPIAIPTVLQPCVCNGVDTPDSDVTPKSSQFDDCIKII